MRIRARSVFAIFILTAIFSISLFVAGCSGGTLSAKKGTSPDPSPSPGTSPSPTPSPTPGGAPSPSPSPTPSSTNGVPHSKHVILVIEENHTFAEVLSSMPWLSSMGTQYAFANDYHADQPGSLLDYLWLSSGSGELSFGCSGSSCTKAVTDDNIFRELTKANVSWKVYADSLPSVGFMGGNVPAAGTGYVDRHNPAKWYSDVIDSPQLQQNMVPFTQFAADVAAGKLPEYSIIVPDVAHDAHNGTLQAADTWLQSNVAPVLKQPYFQAGGDGMMIVTFDECDGAIGACPEQVYTAVIGPRVKPHFQSGLLYKHESALRTILDALGVTVYPGASATAPDMSDFFQ
jgi:phosphatidylinositol-3-phosphatase